MAKIAKFIGKLSNFMEHSRSFQIIENWPKKQSILFPIWPKSKPIELFWLKKGLINIKVKSIKF